MISCAFVEVSNSVVVFDRHEDEDDVVDVVDVFAAVAVLSSVLVPMHVDVVAVQQISNEVLWLRPQETENLSVHFDLVVVVVVVVVAAAAAAACEQQVAAVL